MIQVKLVSTTHSMHDQLVLKHELEVNSAIQMLDQMGMEVCAVEPTQMRNNTQALVMTTALCYEPKTEEAEEK